VNFSLANLDDANLSGADLTGARLYRARLSKAQLARGEPGDTGAQLTAEGLCRGASIRQRETVMSRRLRRSTSGR
jgi:uncharacterized protein YjbI with pentapeptide repeats